MDKDKIEINDFSEMCCKCGREFGGVTDETLVGKCEHCGEVQHVCSMCPCTCGYQYDKDEDNCEGCMWEHVCEKGIPGCHGGSEGTCPGSWGLTVKDGQIYFKEV